MTPPLLLSYPYTSRASRLNFSYTHGGKRNKVRNTMIQKLEVEEGKKTNQEGGRGSEEAPAIKEGRDIKRRRRRI